MNMGEMDRGMTIEELKQTNIDWYINLLRIKRYQKEENPELEYQIKVQRNKLHSLGINTDDYEYGN